MTSEAQALIDTERAREYTRIWKWQFDDGGGYVPGIADRAMLKDFLEGVLSECVIVKPTAPAPAVSSVPAEVREADDGKV